MQLFSLSTDIQQNDFIIGAIKGQIYQYFNTANIADINHVLTKENFPQAIYICKNAIEHFPAQSFHIIIFNIYDTHINQFLFFEFKKKYIICPDNGFITLFNNNIKSNVYGIDLKGSNTILEITEKILQYVHAFVQHYDVSKLSISNVYEEKIPLKINVFSNMLEVPVLFIDHFENVILNINKETFFEIKGERKFKILVSPKYYITEISEHYGTVKDGQYLAWFNSANYLEISIRGGNTASLFGIENYHENHSKTNMFYNKVQIVFEEI